jgi:hypothetical protein
MPSTTAAFLIPPDQHPQASSTSLSNFAIFRGTLLTEAANRLSNACAVRRIGSGAIGDVTLLDVFGSCADLAGRVIEQSLTFIFRKRSPGCL